MRFWRLFSRACRLRCPICGHGRLFRGWFAMHPECAECGTKFEREAGFFLGSIYFNYGLTALVTVIAYPLLKNVRSIPPQTATASVLTFVVVFPLWFFRYARSLWLGFDQFVDPRPEVNER